VSALDIKVGNNYYATVTEALADAADSSDVLFRNREFAEDITLARSGVLLNLKGGYASDFTT